MRLNWNVSRHSNSYVLSMNITFYDDPLAQEPQDVRLRQLGLFVYEDLRRIAVGFELTPFRERPSIEAIVTNEAGQWAGSLTVIETLTPNLTLTMHLRDELPTNQYTMQVIVYYATPETERRNVDAVTVTFPVMEAGEQVFQFPVDKDR